ncbi:glycosyltransferase family 2 protein [Pseudorhodobacter sp. W20_MBD10_FR17]|uniref:glycosyltransferase family 2 protein n=1 Tax=Pseudorhodobacter sp. W20_MBD10_FR17 TaxID=3240266 RepID=UPI003F9ACFA9
MQYTSLSTFLDKERDSLAKGPVAIILAEDAVELESTLRHHLEIGFRTVLLLANPQIALSDTVAALITRVEYDIYQRNAIQTAVNQLIEAAPNTWLYYGYNAEYLFFPFCESRNVREMIAFHTEERGSALLSYVIDLYAEDLNKHPNAVSLEDAMLDKSGYYALGRPDPANHNHARERQLDFFGGLRWRFEEHIPTARRKIDRIALFRAKPGLRLRPNFTFSDEEYNTYACPWHHNITTAVVSFRTAKALKSNPGSRYDIHEFKWHNSTKFQWNSQQLMDLGLMEPGQWF